jgi:hypothetical protein
MTAATLHRCLIAVLSQPERTYRRLTADEVTKLKAERVPGMYPDVNFRSGRSDMFAEWSGTGRSWRNPSAFGDHFPALTASS